MWSPFNVLYLPILFSSATVLSQRRSVSRPTLVSEFLTFIFCIFSCRFVVLVSRTAVGLTRDKLQFMFVEMKSFVFIRCNGTENTLSGTENTYLRLRWCRCWGSLYTRAFDQKKNVKYHLTLINTNDPMSHSSVLSLCSLEIWFGSTPPFYVAQICITVEL